MKRGEIYWVALDPTVGVEINKTRPCVIVTVNIINRLRRSVVMVPLTTQGREALPLLVRLDSADSFAVCDQIRVVAKERIHNVRGELSEADMVKLENNLRAVLGL